jgi:hypothetical protein|eukprot:7391162-Prymnesium_polylepis.1
MQAPITELLNDLRLLFEANTGDLTIVVSGGDDDSERSFTVVSSIVRKRSNVLDRMLSHDMKEGQEMRVTMNDACPADVESFLLFLYTAHVELLETNVASLFMLADYYDVPSLRVLCKDWVFSELSVDNVSGVLSSAYRYGRDELIESCLSFVDVKAPALLPHLYMLSMEQLDQIMSRETLCITDEELAEILLRWSDEKRCPDEVATQLLASAVRPDALSSDWKAAQFNRNFKRLFLENAMLADLFSTTLADFLAPLRAKVTGGVFSSLYTYAEWKAMPPAGEETRKHEDNLLNQISSKFPFHADRAACFMTRSNLTFDHSDVNHLYKCIVSGQDFSFELMEGHNLTYLVPHRRVQPSMFRLNYHEDGSPKATRKPPKLVVLGSEDGTEWTVLLQDASLCPSTTAQKDGCRLEFTIVFRARKTFKWIRVKA